MFVCVLVFIIKLNKINLIVFTFSFIFWCVCTLSLNNLPGMMKGGGFFFFFFSPGCVLMFGFFSFLCEKMFVTSDHVAPLELERSIFFQNIFYFQN